MARGPRWEMPGGMHHVTARAPKDLVLFRADDDRRLYLDLLATEVRMREWSLWSYALMTTHIHLLLVTPQPNLGLGIKAIHEHFATVLHRTYGSHGHVFGARFFNKPVLTDDHRAACLRYIARNPIASGHCTTPAGWRWSAHHALAGTVPAPTFLDAAAVHAVLPPDAYRQLTATTDTRLITQLKKDRPDTWLAHAADDHRIPLPELADREDIHLTTLRRRLATARSKRDRPPASGGSPETAA